MLFGDLACGNFWRFWNEIKTYWTTDQVKGFCDVLQKLMLHIEDSIYKKNVVHKI